MKFSFIYEVLAEIYALHCRTIVNPVWQPEVSNGHELVIFTLQL